MLNDEFNDLQTSLPSPNFINIFRMIENRKDKDEEYKALILYIINDPIEFSKFGSEILKVVINEKNDFIIHIIQLIFDKIIELIKKNSADYSYMALISLYLPKLCDHYSHLVTKYIIYTSIPICLSIKNSTNTSLHAYSNNISIEKSIPSNNSYIKRLISFYKSLTHHLKIKEEIISFIIPFPQICKYQDNNYNNWNEILYKPKPILFYNIDTNNFYKWWNFAAIIDFKWKIFEKIYYLIWLIYTIFFLCFALASTLEQDNNNILFIISILLGFIHLTFEIRQCLWNPKFYFTDLWNLFDVGAYFLSIITSIYWLIYGKPPLWIIAFSNLLLNIKFLLFFRVFESFGIYFVLMIGVAKKVFPFLIVLFLIISGFAHAFFILLKPNKNDDDNSINPDGTTLIQSPNSNTNMFSLFPTSLLAMYLLLIGNSDSLSPWTSHQTPPSMAFFLVLFTFFTVIYLMNLFIGLLNVAIENYDKNEEFLLQKAKIIMEIELFYMLPYQRCNKKWFPDWIHYDIPVNKVYKLINAIDNNRTEFNSPPFISNRLRNLLKIPEPINENKSFEELKQQMRDEFKQQIKDMQELLNSFIKNSNTYHVNTK
ncbi:hypothetical protein RhiirA5_415467 [Rhizophagus irregularis]|uniref:Ion transport domain-containing protein n=2 Tax=Rhizophagus irregularis TaxID=588596 RepID=A0A2N0PS40_9GLOM|nr:hypothetical protein RhiirA5_415467 [Rhizophagus irregularis]